MSLIFEWAAVLTALLSVYLYGKSVRQGAWWGIATLLPWSAFAINGGHYALMVSNVVFTVAHINNLRKAKP